MCNMATQNGILIQSIADILHLLQDGFALAPGMFPFALNAASSVLSASLMANCSCPVSPITSSDRSKCPPLLLTSALAHKTTSAFLRRLQLDKQSVLCSEFLPACRRSRSQRATHNHLSGSQRESWFYGWRIPSDALLLHSRAAVSRATFRTSSFLTLMLSLSVFQIWQVFLSWNIAVCVSCVF